jgi:hypothetical protein
VGNHGQDRWSVAGGWPVRTKDAAVPHERNGGPEAGAPSSPAVESGAPPGYGERSVTEDVRMREARRLSMVGLSLTAMVVLAGCPSSRPTSGSPSSASSTSAGREKGVKDATDAIAAGKLKLKEYPSLPYPPGHQEYVQLLRDRCEVEYEVPRLPPGVAETDFIQEVRSWNEIMEAEVRRKFGIDIFERLHEEARQLRQKQLNPSGKQ